LLRRGAIWRDRLRDTKYRGEHFKDHPTVENPDKISSQCGEECD